MRQILALVGVTVAVAGCSDARQHSSVVGRGPPQESAVASAPKPNQVTTWLDQEAARTIMSARAEFDAVEQAIMLELERRIGSYHDTVSISMENRARHLSGPRLPIERSAGWKHEQQQRVVYARMLLTPALEEARNELARKTVRALGAFFQRERGAGRITRADYARYTAEIRRGVFPPFRGRKWSGPPVYEFRGAQVEPEYRKILREVRLLWQAQGRNMSAVASRPTTPQFYRALVPPR
jgi:hypothetical protein